MSPVPLPPAGSATGLAGALAILAQTAEPITRFAAESAAAQPAVVARGFRFLIAAYSAVWFILAVYIVSVSVRLRRLSNQVRRMKEQSGA